MRFPEYEERKRDLLDDYSASEWLKRQIVIAESRDILDMLNDIEVLQELLMVKWNEAVEAIKGKKTV